MDDLDCILEAQLEGVPDVLDHQYHPATSKMMLTFGDQARDVDAGLRQTP